MEIRRIQGGELPAAMDLCWRVFLEFEAPEYPPEGVEAFRAYLSDIEQVNHLTLFGAWEGQELLGVLAGGGEPHRPVFRRPGGFTARGIGRLLFQAYLAEGGPRADHGSQLPLCSGGLPPAGLFSHGRGTAVPGRHPIHAHGVGANMKEP